MEQNDSNEPNNKATIRRILKLSDAIFHAIRLNIPHEWLTSDMTIAQLRVLLLLYTDGASRMGSIASNIGTTLSTVTGTVDLLVKKGLIVRKDDPEDRRIVLCELSARGKKIMNLLWVSSERQMQSLLHGLSPEELKKAEEVAEILLRNAKSKTKANPA